MDFRPKFFHKRDALPDEVQARIPPGQYLAKKWPVLTYGPTPKIAPQDWQLRLFGEVEAPVVLTWDDVMQMPQVEIETDFHCVTHWSKLDNRWEGVAIGEVLKRVQVKPAATHVMVHAYGGYTTNLPLVALQDDDVLLAYGHNGENLAPEHGFPMRLVVPKRYAWKSVKWISGLEFLAGDRPGFWERNGYHNDADPWKEERYW